MKTTFITLRVSQETKEEVETEAKKESRNTSNYLIWLHEKHTNKKTNS